MGQGHASAPSVRARSCGLGLPSRHTSRLFPPKNNAWNSSRAAEAGDGPINLDIRDRGPSIHSCGDSKNKKNKKNPSVRGVPASIRLGPSGAGICGRGNSMEMATF